MKTAVLCLLMVLACASARPGEDKQTSRYDGIDLKDILSVRWLLVPFVKCVLDQGRCTPDGSNLKSVIREALETYCEKCTKTQNEDTRRIFGHLINHEEDYWNQLIIIYDPNRRYAQKYENELRVVQAQG